MIAITLTDTITLGAVLTAVLVVIIGGLPIQLIRGLRTERDEWRERALTKEAEVKSLNGQLAEARARTNLDPIVEEIRQLVASVGELATTSTERHERFAQNLEANAKLTQGLVKEMNDNSALLRQIGRELLDRDKTR